MERRTRERMVNEYHAAARAYSDAVGRLIGLTGADFNHAYQQAEALRVKCEESRRALDDMEGTKAAP